MGRFSSLLMDSVRKYGRAYQMLFKLEENRSAWSRRHLLMLDFSEGRRTWLEKESIDIRTTILIDLAKKFYLPAQGGKKRENFLYIPLGWRTKESYLQYDCSLNDGHSASLMNRKFNEGYAYWLFLQWFGDDLPECINEYVARIVCNDARKDKSQCFCTCNEFRVHNLHWESLGSQPQFDQYLEKVEKHHIVAIKLRADRDFSLIKTSERRTGVWRSSLMPGSDRTGYCVKRTAVTRPIESIKVFMPKDIRLVRAYGTYGGQISAPTNRKMDIYSDRWGANHDRDVPVGAISIRWLFWIAPCRTQIIFPTLHGYLVSFICCVFWFFGRVSYRDPQARGGAFFLMTALLAPFVVAGVTESIKSSYMHRQLTKRYRRALAALVVLVITFLLSPTGPRILAVRSPHEGFPVAWIGASWCDWILLSPRILIIVVIGVYASWIFRMSKSIAPQKGT
ncbi:hypothetical protein [Actinomyces sp. oral taxon 897]|uniref:hypothetical protein n=1 Tax=Actinomyces sp. oral taxon 897 TaxID=2081702 RepID=UPI00101AD29F|nr:hypothetical protein [Actinomyces sp. oral taxon 897]